MEKKFFILISFLLIWFLFSNTAFSSEKLLLPKIIEQAWPSVVQVASFDKTGEASVGTGFFVFPGKILTNAHVVDNAFSAAICSEEYIENEQVTVLKIDHELDLALLEVEDLETPCLPLAKIHNFQIGQPVVKIGFPTGDVKTASDGIIRSIVISDSTFVVSAPSAPGSSGSPILNLSGEVIGILSSCHKEAQNLNLAIDIQTIKEFLIRPDYPRQLEVAESQVLWMVILRKFVVASSNIFKFTSKVGKWIFYAAFNILILLLFVLILVSISKKFAPVVATARKFVVRIIVVVGIGMIPIFAMIGILFLFDESAENYVPIFAAIAIMLGAAFYFLVKKVWAKFFVIKRQNRGSS